MAVGNRESTQADLRATFEAVSDPIAITGPGDEASIVWVNPAFERASGWSRDDVVGRTLDEVQVPVPDRDDPELVVAMRRAGGEFRFRRHRRAISNGSGAITGWVEVQRACDDVHAGTNFRELFDGLREPLAIHRDGRLVRVNPAFLELLGFEASEVIGRSGIELIHRDDRRRIAALVNAAPPVARTEPTPVHRLVRKDGSSVHVEVYSMPIHYEGSSMSLSLARDLTEPRRLDTQLRTAERLASIGRLAASVGHEINNPLAYMLATMDLMAKELERDAPDRIQLLERLAHVREGAERVRDIVRELKTFVRDDHETRDAIDIHAVVDRALDMADHEVRYRARVVRRYHATRRAWANEPRLQQVFLNLVINAAHAIDTGPRDAHEISVTTSDDGPDRVAIEVADTGNGVAPENLERVFEPFFTTKPVGVGTGLGLSISHHIITSIGGTIALAPRPTGGTTVRISLPAARPRVAPTVATDPAVSVARARIPARVLVVDDEQQLAAALAGSLDHHDVSTARGGQDAIDMLRGSAFDLIVSDLHMAEVSGVDLYEHVRTTYPGLEHRMIFMTGGAFTDRARAFLARVTPRVLDKPFEIEILDAAIDDIMCGRAREHG